MPITYTYLALAFVAVSNQPVVVKCCLCIMNMIKGAIFSCESVCEIAIAAIIYIYIYINI